MQDLASSDPREKVFDDLLTRETARRGQWVVIDSHLACTFYSTLDAAGFAADHTEGGDVYIRCLEARGFIYQPNKSFGQANAGILEA